MSLFYTGQTDYIDKLNLVGGKNAKSTFTCSTTSTKTIDLNAGHIVVLNITGTSQVVTTIAFNNLPTGTATPLEIVIYAIITDPTLLHSIVWPAEVRWSAGAAAPALTSTGADKTDIFILRSYNSGNTFYGVGGANIDLNNYNT